MQTEDCGLEPDALGLRLLPVHALVTTSGVDHADWNYRPILGRVSRLRYLLLQKIFSGRTFDRVLEIGYGSGVYLPHLASLADEVYGIDPHLHCDEITTVLNRFGVQARLASGSATALPYQDQFFDCVVAISALEFIDDLPLACQEILRVLRPGGMLAVVTPGDSKLLDVGLKFLTGASPKDDFGGRRAAIVPTLLTHFDLRQRVDRPRYLHQLVRLYTAFELTPKVN